MNYACKIIYLSIFLFSLVKCHSVNSKQLLWVEPISSVQLDIAQRSTEFFEKRGISENNHYQPNVRSLEYDDSLRLQVNAFNKTIYLHLAPNLDLFHPNAVFHEQGKSVPINPSQYRVYHGYVIDDIYSDHWWISGLQSEQEMEDQAGVLGWARIMVRNDIKHELDYPMFEGTFSIDGDIHHVKLTNNYLLTKRSDDAELESANGVHMIMYRDSDTAKDELNPYDHSSGHCGFDNLAHTQSVFDRTAIDNPFAIKPTYNNNFGSFDSGKTLSKRAPPAGCPTAKKILYMGAAADCTYVKRYQSADNARAQIINDWNSVSTVYSSTFNVAIGLINITIMDSACPSSPSASTRWNQECSASYPISSRLSDFSSWRGSIGDDGAGLWHLVTNCATGVEVGIAWLGQVCNTGARASGGGETTSGTGLSSVIRDGWKVIAHEIGHNFGANHDCTSQDCPCSTRGCNCCQLSSTQCDAGGEYFMNPSSNSSSDSFSPCSINTICSAMPQYSCLEDPGSRTITTLKMCGNGIKEEGEDCDTGGKESACCDPATCKFKTGAVCDDFNDLCCNNCQVRPANYTCRPSSNECDIAEVCSGTSGDCPPDVFKDDLTSCSNGLKCASGQCTSRDAQCVARGATQNIRKSCGADSGCQISCQDPRSSLSCIIFPGYFLDGTPCGVASTCKAGKCNSDNFGNNAKNWIENNKQIVIPVAIFVGLLLIFCLFRCCCYSRSSGYNNIGKTTTYVIPAQQPQYGQYSTQPPYYPPPPNNQYYTPPPPPPNGWVDPAQYNGANYGPQAPLPVYSQNDAYELNNANTWQNNNRAGTASPPVPQSPAPGFSPSPANAAYPPPPSGNYPPPPQSPANYPTPPPHGTNPQRPYHEGVI